MNLPFVRYVDKYGKEQKAYTSFDEKKVNLSTKEVKKVLEISNGVDYLFCRERNLTTLPAFPQTLKALYCEKNNLQTLPPLPESLFLLSCYDNFNLKGSIELDKLPEISYLDFGNTQLILEWKEKNTPSNLYKIVINKLFVNLKTIKKLKKVLFDLDVTIG